MTLRYRRAFARSSNLITILGRRPPVSVARSCGVTAPRWRTSTTPNPIGSKEQVDASRFIRVPSPPFGLQAVFVPRMSFVEPRQF